MALSNHSKRLSLRQVILLVPVLLFFNSCVSRKQTDYFQLKKDSVSKALTIPLEFEPPIQPNDLLEIRVTSLNPEATVFFNPGLDASSGTTNEGSQYLVDRNGNIEIPLVGVLNVTGKSTAEIRDTLRSRLEKYLQNPTVNVYFKTYKITVLGEVKMPGVYYINNEKASLTEVLGLAGDMTIYGDRENVLIIREEKGAKNFGYLDLTTRDVFTSPYYYLRPNDIVYIAAGKGRLASSDTFYRIAPLLISFLTLLTLIAVRIDVAK